MILKQNGIWGEIMYENVEYDQHFIGEFDVEGDLFNGELIFNKKNGGILIHLTKDVTIESAFRYHYGKVAVIIGKLNAGIVVTLFNNRCVKNHTNNFKLLTLNFVSDYFVWSDKERRDTLYNKMVSILENAYKWSGFSAFESVPGGVKIVDTLPQKTYNWFGVKITFSPCLNNYILLPFKEEETKIIQRLSVTIESSCKMPLDEFIKIRNRVTSLISFAIKDNVNVDDEYLIDFDDSYTIGLKEAGYTEYSKHYLFASSPILDTFSTYIHEYNFRMNQLPEDDTLNVKLDKLKPIFNLYLSLFKYPYMPHEMVFLNIAQALETFHARFFYDDNKDQFVKSVHQRFGSLPNFETYKKLLLSNAQKKSKHIILVSRLNDLFIGTNDGLFAEYYLKTNYAQKITDTRHYYTHYGEAREAAALKGNDLLQATYILRLLLEYHVCLILGINNTAKIAHSLQAQSNSQKNCN